MFFMYTAISPVIKSLPLALVRPSRCKGMYASVRNSERILSGKSNLYPVAVTAHNPTRMMRTRVTQWLAGGVPVARRRSPAAGPAVAPLAAAATP